MKLLCPVILLLLSFKAYAQDKNIYQQLEKLLQERANQYKFYYGPADTFNLKAPNAGTLPAPGVYSLPQDNMPCMVPDQNAVVQIPNAIKPRIPYNSHIPNATPPNRTPSKKAKPFQKKWVPVFIGNKAD